MKWKEWLECLLNVKFKDRDILIGQALKTEAVYEYGDSFVSYKMKVKGDVELYHCKVRVPIEMRAFQQTGSPIIFLLHVIDGLIDELEIVSADLSKIEEDKISLENVEYVIAPEVAVQKE